MPFQSLFEISTAAHLAGSLVLTVFFALLARHEPTPYLRYWGGAWATQAAGLAVLLFSLLRNWHGPLFVSLFLISLHGLLLCQAARIYLRGAGYPRDYALVLAPVALWCFWAASFSPRLAELHAAPFGVLAVTYFLAAVLLWPRREARFMGLRLVTNVLALLSLVYLVHAAVFAWALASATESLAVLEVAPFVLLFLQVLLCLGMALVVMERGQRALGDANRQLEDAHRRLKSLAETDPLTGFFNRRVFRELVDEVRAARTSASGVVLLLDLDGLKVINDAQGHSAGDQAIRRTALAIRSRTRNSDILVRWGGDEFVVVLPGASWSDAEHRRDEIADAIAKEGLSASAGLSAYGPDHDIVLAVREADRTMYEAKARRKAAAAGLAAG